MEIIDNRYYDVVKDIFEDPSFLKLKEIEHHGTTRWFHSVRVSYYSYLLARTLKLNEKATARAGLLHDFFFSEKGRRIDKKFLSTFTHPKKALDNASIFGLSELEENIIVSHMFPLYYSLPKYAESWLVSIVDKIVGIKELSEKLGQKFVYAGNVFILVLFNIVK